LTVEKCGLFVSPATHGWQLSDGLVYDPVDGVQPFGLSKIHTVQEARLLMRHVIPQHSAQKGKERWQRINI